MVTQLAERLVNGEQPETVIIAEWTDNGLLPNIKQPTAADRLLIMYTVN